jgi:hypothetical protein
MVDQAMVELDESKKALAATTDAEHAARSEAEGLRQQLSDARLQAATAGPGLAKSRSVPTT